jgi:putative ABC transport system permease protein
VTALDERPVVPPDLAPAPRWAGRRAVLRLARRDALRHRARSLLVIAMIALPVAGLAAVDVVARTGQVQGTSSGLGLPAGVDAQVRWYDGSTVEQTPDGSSVSYGGDGDGADEPPTDDEVARRTGATVVLSSRSDSGRLVLPDGRSRSAELVETELESPLAPAVVGTVVGGRAPQAPGEVALSRGALDAVRAEPGDTVRLSDRAAAVRVVGEVRSPGEPAGGEPQAVRVVGRDGLLAETSGWERTWFLRTPEPLRWDDVLRLNELGYVVVSRAVLDDPPPDEQVPLLAQQQPTEPDLDAAAFVVLAAGMGLLEVVLLAGPAFAVGARRSKRLLALLAATGGDRRQVRDVVLAQGLVLGLVGAATGLVLGVLLGVAALPVLERVQEQDLAPAVLRPLDLLAIGLVGLVTAVLAALLPARGVSRQDVAVTLAGRREPVRARAGVPVLGLALAVVGFVLVLVGVQRRSPLTILAGAALGQVGLVLCTPTVVRLLGRTGRFLPLTPRLAVRDAARNLGRTAPAVAAVMAAVAGTVASSIFVASLSEHDERMYVPQLPPGQLQVVPSSGSTGADVADVERAVRGFLPGSGITTLHAVGARCSSSGCVEVLPVVPQDGRCPLEALTRPPTDAELTAAERDPRCTGVAGGRGFGGSPSVDDGTALPLLLGRDDAAAGAALRAGRALVLDPRLVANGTVELEVTGDGSRRTLRLPAQPVTPAEGDWNLPASVVLPPATADSLGLPVVVRELRVVPQRSVTEAQEERLARAVSSGTDYLYVERGYQDAYAPGLLALVIGAALVTVGAVATSTSLAMTDARPDLATMAAVGASRSVRRRMALVTALVLAGLGAALGAVAGGVPGVAAVRALQQDAGAGDWPLVVPWTSLLLIAVVAPLAAGLLIALFTRSRLPVVHRRDS